MPVASHPVPGQAALLSCSLSLVHVCPALCCPDGDDDVDDNGDDDDGGGDADVLRGKRRRDKNPKFYI